MSVDDGQVTISWKTLLGLAILLSGGSSGVTMAWFPDPEQLVTRQEMDDYVKRDELLRELSNEMRPIREGVAQINAKLEVVLSHSANHERRISKLEAK